MALDRRKKTLITVGALIITLTALTIAITVTINGKTPREDGLAVTGSHADEGDTLPDRSVIPDLDIEKSGVDWGVSDPVVIDVPSDDDDTDPDDDPDDEIPDDPPPPPFGRVAESERAPDSYFDDAVFIGDSVSIMLQYNAMKIRKDDPTYLGEAQFLTAGSFSYSNALAGISEKSVHPTYQGEKHYIEDSIAKMGAKKVYIMLGMNEIAHYNYDKTFENLAEVVRRILAKSPDVTLFFQSVTPRMENSQGNSLNNDIIHGYNKLLEKYCEDNGYYYLDIASAVADADGHLQSQYCSDPIGGGNGMGIHFTYAACEAWTEYLYTHTVPVVPTA